MRSSTSFSQWKTDPGVTKQPLLAGLGVPADKIEDIANVCGCKATSKADKADIVLVRNPNKDKLGALLKAAPPYALIEHPAPKSVFGKRLRHVLERRGIFLSLTTATAFGSDLTGILCDACAKRTGMKEERRFDVETAVEEALSNAMVHGNLDIASVLRNDPADFDLYCDLVNERLKSPNYAERRVEIVITWDDDKLEIEVHDEGRGYDISNLHPSPQIEAKSGRGFSLIRDMANSVTVGEHGRSLTMSFNQ